MKRSLILCLTFISCFFAINSFAGIGGSGGGVSLTWKTILSSDLYQVKGSQIVFQKGISAVYTTVLETCIREIESDPIIETLEKIHFIELDKNNKKIENYDYLSKSVRDFKQSPIKKYNLDVYIKASRFAPIDERNKITKEFEIPKCED